MRARRPKHRKKQKSKKFVFECYDRFTLSKHKKTIAINTIELVALVIDSYKSQRSIRSILVKAAKDHKFEDDESYSAREYLSMQKQNYKGFSVLYRIVFFRRNEINFNPTKKRNELLNQDASGFYISEKTLNKLRQILYAVYEMPKIEVITNGIY